MEEKKGELTLKDIKEKDISELFKKIKLSDEIIKEIMKVGDNKFENLMNEKYKPIEDKEEQEEKNELLKECYLDIIYILRKYCDLKEEYYSIIALWIIGTYMHDHFPSYPYLFINAMKGSGKSRLLRLITTLSKDGSQLNSLTEAVLFRTKGTLGIDEFEEAVRKGNESLKELLNSAYKQGVKVKRMKKVKTLDGENQVVEEFDVYRPIVIANIFGMEQVLNDRCLNIILDRSDNQRITNLIEIFAIDENILHLKKKLHSMFCEPFTRENGQISVVSVDVVSLQNIYVLWNEYNYTNYTNTTNNTNYTNYTLKMFAKIIETKIQGRDLELTFPLFILAQKIGILNEITINLKKIIEERKDEDAIENTDITLLDFISQEVNPHFQSLNNILKNFKDYLKNNEEWINNKWLGRALKRLNVILEKRRTNCGIEVKLNIIKAQEKIRMFK